MKLLRRAVKLLLVLCSALWVISCGEQAPPPSCNATLVFSSETSSSSWEGSGNINLRSLSPWTWRSTTVKNRIPSTIWEADCSSEFCSSPEPGRGESHDLNSVPVYQNLLVLTRRAGHCNYTASYRSVAVGCTCVRAIADQN